MPPIININGNILVKTAAQWAADSTVYSAKTMLVTSDSNWGTSDQRKFKIADGVQTWTNLEYPPFLVSVPTLAQVLSSGNSTGDTTIVGSDGLFSLYVNTAIGVLGYDDGAGTSGNAGVSATGAQMDWSGLSASGLSKIDETQNRHQHDILVNLDAPSVRLSQETASRVAILDSNKDIVGADTTTYPSLTELSYVKGVTSAVQTQINGRGFVLQGAGNGVNPADGATHSFADANVGTSTTYVTTVRLYVPKAATLKRVHVFNRNTAGSNETGTFYVVKNGVTDITISAAVVWNGDNTFSNSSLNTSFAEGDWFNFKVAYPTWVTNPTAVSYTVSLYFE